MFVARSWKAPTALITCLIMVVGFMPSRLGAQASKVVEVKITGNENVNNEAILAVVDLKANDEYSEETIEKDKADIMALGYFSAVSSRKEDVPGGVCVIYDVVENPVVKDIKVVGSGPLDAAKVLETMRTKPGRVLNTATLNLDIEAVQRMYSDAGYVGTYITEDIGIDRDTGVLTIPVLVPVVESIDIVGNKKTQEKVFLREMKTKPGNIFNINTLKEDMARIYSLDILEDIQAPQLETGSEVGKVKIALPVTEKKTGQVSLGLGYSSRQKLVGRAELTETNFRGQGQGLNLLWETGVSSGSSGRSSYEIGFHEPWLDKHHTSGSINVFNKALYRFSSGLLGSGSTISDDDDTYFERRKGGTLGVSRPIQDKTRVFLTLRSEDVTPHNLVSLFSIDDIAQSIKVFSQGLVRSAAVKMVNNTRDVDIDPATGGYHSLSFEFGNVDGNTFDVERDENGNIIANPNNPEMAAGLVDIPQKGNFQKIMADVRRYFPIGGPRQNPTDKKKVIALRVQGGFANGTIPFFEQFFVGGAESIRGYREDRFWGSKMLVASAEYRVPIANSLTGVAFVDYGDAWGDNQDVVINGLAQHDGFEPVLGTGIGIRVNTPIGNLRLDYGFGSEGSRTHFSIGHAF